MIERYVLLLLLLDLRELKLPSLNEFAAREVAARLSDSGLDLVQILTPCDWEAGERGIAAVAGREADFRASVGIAIEYAVQVGKPLIHAMAGNLEPGVNRRKAQATFLENIAFAADQASAEGLTIVLEFALRVIVSNVPHRLIDQLNRQVDATPRYIQRAIG